MYQWYGNAVMLFGQVNNQDATHAGNLAAQCTLRKDNDEMADSVFCIRS
jgi:hypothetical protein